MADNNAEWHPILGGLREDAVRECAEQWAVVGCEEGGDGFISLRKKVASRLALGSVKPDHAVDLFRTMSNLLFGSINSYLSQYLLQNYNLTWILSLVYSCMPEKYGEYFWLYQQHSTGYLGAHR